jgi:hypothetical protein
MESVVTSASGDLGNLPTDNFSTGSSENGDTSTVDDDSDVWEDTGIEDEMNTPGYQQLR